MEKPLKSSPKKEDTKINSKHQNPYVKKKKNTPPSVRPSWLSNSHNALGRPEVQEDSAA